MHFLLYLMLVFILGGSVLIIVRCFVSVRREPTTPKLTAIIAALLVCIALALATRPVHPGGAPRPAHPASGFAVTLPHSGR